MYLYIYLSLYVAYTFESGQIIFLYCFEPFSVVV